MKKLKEILNEILNELKSINKKLSALTLNPKDKTFVIDLTNSHLDEAIHDTLAKFIER